MVDLYFLALYYLVRKLKKERRNDYMKDKSQRRRQFYNSIFASSLGTPGDPKYQFRQIKMHYHSISTSSPEPLGQPNSTAFSTATFYLNMLA